MKIYMSLLLMAGLYCSNVFGDLTPESRSQEAPVTHLKHYPKEVLRNEIVNFLPVKGFNINLEAPNDCGGGKEIAINKKKVRCQYSAAGRFQPKIYVCDDGKKTCFIEKAQVSLKDKRSFWEKMLSLVKGDGGKPHYPNHVTVSPNKGIDGFIHNDLALAQQTARREKKQLLVYSTQQYCPPCMLVKEFTIADPKFKEITKNFVLVQLDSEIDTYNHVKKEWNIKYTPTFVVATAELEEVAKLVSFASLAKMTHWLRNVAMYAGEPLAAVKKRIESKKAKDADYERVGKNQFRGGHYDKALVNLQKVENRSEGVRQMIEFILVKSKKDIELLEGAVAFNRNHPHFPSVQDELWAILESEEVALPKRQKVARKLFRDIIDHKAEYIKKNPRDLDNVLDLMYLRRIYASYLLKIKKRKPALAQTEEALRLIRSFAVTEKQKAGTGVSIYEASLNSNVGNFTDSEEIYKKKMQAEPKNFTFEYLNAYELSEKKEYDEALAELKKAEAKAKGKQWVQVKKLEIGILIKAKRIKEAKMEIQKQLQKVHLPKDQNARVHSLVSALRKFEGEL